LLVFSGEYTGEDAGGANNHRSRQGGRSKLPRALPSTSENSPTFQAPHSFRNTPFRSLKIHPAIQLTLPPASPIASSLKIHDLRITPPSQAEKSKRQICLLPSRSKKRIQKERLQLRYLRLLLFKKCPSFDSSRHWSGNPPRALVRKPPESFPPLVRKLPEQFQPQWSENSTGPASLQRPRDPGGPDIASTTEAVVRGNGADGDFGRATTFRPQDQEANLPLDLRSQPARSKDEFDL
jgi:hypothetical protein